MDITVLTRHQEFVNKLSLKYFGVTMRCGSVTDVSAAALLIEFADGLECAGT